MIRLLIIVICLLTAQIAFAQQNTIIYEGDALDQVNYERGLLGLRPYKHDHLLARAAKACCRHRAVNYIEGHYNDHAFLPVECNTKYKHIYNRYIGNGRWSGYPAGCARWPVLNRVIYKNGKKCNYSGLGSCCTLENWSYAGAYYCVGADGQKYMQLFVR